MNDFNTNNNNIEYKLSEAIRAGDLESTLADLIDEAAIKGDTSIVQMLLDRKADVDSCMDDDYHTTPLIAASHYGHYETVKLLISNKADLEAYLHQSEVLPDGSALCQAAANGNMEIVSLLIEKGAKVDGVSSQSDFTPLAFPSLKGHEAVVSFLIKNGAKVDGISSQSHISPLLLANFAGHTNIEKLLIAAGANPNIVADHRILLNPFSEKNLSEELEVILMNMAKNSKTTDSIKYNREEETAKNISNKGA